MLKRDAIFLIPWRAKWGRGRAKKDFARKRGRKIFPRVRTDLPCTHVFIIASFLHISAAIVTRRYSRNMLERHRRILLSRKRYFAFYVFKFLKIYPIFRATTWKKKIKICIQIMIDYLIKIDFLILYRDVKLLFFIYLTKPWNLCSMLTFTESEI